MNEMISQSTWTNKAMDAIDNLEYEGLYKVFKYLENELFKDEEDRNDLVQRISLLENMLDDRDNDISNLTWEISNLTEDDGK